MIDHNVCAASHLYEDVYIDPLEENMLLAIDAAQAAQDKFKEMEEALKEKLEVVMGALIKEGQTIKRNRGGLPSWFRQVKTVRGKDHGTDTFLIASPVLVKVVVTHPELSTWSCEASPVSEKTGKVLNGASHGADGNRPTVRLSGSITTVWDDDDEPYSALLKVVAAASIVIGEAENAATCAAEDRVDWPGDNP